MYSFFDRGGSRSRRLGQAVSKPSVVVDSRVRFAATAAVGEQTGKSRGRAQLRTFQILNNLAESPTRIFPLRTTLQATPARPPGFSALLRPFR